MLAGPRPNNSNNDSTTTTNNNFRISLIQKVFYKEGI